MFLVLALDYPGKSVMTLGIKFYLYDGLISLD